jgi:hypothetical protein
MNQKIHSRILREIKNIKKEEEKGDVNFIIHPIEENIFEIHFTFLGNFKNNL